MPFGTGGEFAGSGGQGSSDPGAGVNSIQPDSSNTIVVTPSGGTGNVLVGVPTGTFVANTPAVIGAPTSGNWLKGQVVYDEIGVGWLCTVGGTPGTWSNLLAARTGVIYAKDFGAVGDETTNDTTAILAALAAAEAASIGASGEVVTSIPVVFSGPGVYRMTSPIVPYQGMQLIVEGVAREFASNVIILNNTTDTFTPAGNVENITIRGIEFDGSGPNKNTNWWTPNGDTLSYSSIDQCGFKFFASTMTGTPWTGVYFRDFYIDSGLGTQINASGADSIFGPGFVGGQTYATTTLTQATTAGGPQTVTVASTSGATIGNPVYLGLASTQDVGVLSAIPTAGNITIGTTTHNHGIGDQVTYASTSPLVQCSLSHSRIDRVYPSPGPGLPMEVSGGHNSLYLNCEVSGANTNFPSGAPGAALYVNGAAGCTFVGMQPSSCGGQLFAFYQGAITIFDSTDLTFEGTGFGNITNPSMDLFYIGRSGGGGVPLTSDIKISGNAYFTVTAAARTIGLNTAMAAALSAAQILWDEWPVPHLVTAVTAAHTASLTDETLACTASAALPISLPAIASVPTGKEYQIIDVAGTAAANNITATANGSDRINGLASAAIVTNYGVLVLRSTGVEWAVVASTSAKLNDRFVTGNWYPGPNNLATATAQTENDLYAIPFILNATHTFSQIGVDATVGGGAGSVLDLGIYLDNGAGYPGVLVHDFGTVASTGTGGITITASVTLTPGLYWLGVAPQGSATTPTLQTMGTSEAANPIGSTSPGSAAQVGWRLAAVSGSLPNPFTAGASAVATVPLVQLKA